MNDGTEGPASYALRLTRAAEIVADRRSAWRAALDLRDRVIVEAVEAGVTVRAVARAARLSEGRVVAIVAAN